MGEGRAKGARTGGQGRSARSCSARARPRLLRRRGELGCSYWRELEDLHARARATALVARAAARTPCEFVLLASTSWQRPTKTGARRERTTHAGHDPHSCARPHAMLEDAWDLPFSRGGQSGLGEATRNPTGHVTVFEAAGVMLLWVGAGHKALLTLSVG